MKRSFQLLSILISSLYGSFAHAFLTDFSLLSQCSKDYTPTGVSEKWGLTTQIVDVEGLARDLPPAVSDFFDRLTVVLQPTDQRKNIRYLLMSNSKKTIRCEILRTTLLQVEA